MVVRRIGGFGVLMLGVTKGGERLIGGCLRHHVARFAAGFDVVFPGVSARAQVV